MMAIASVGPTMVHTGLRPVNIMEGNRRAIVTIES
jgi:hypothetical protein